MKRTKKKKKRNKRSKEQKYASPKMKSIDGFIEIKDKDDQNTQLISGCACCCECY